MKIEGLKRCNDIKAALLFFFAAAPDSGPEPFILK